MKCPIYKLGEMQEGFTQVVLTRDNATVIFRNVPAKICDNCGEYYLDEQTAQNIYIGMTELIWQVILFTSMGKLYSHF